MFDLDHWREIYSVLSGNKLRTFLTAFGVFWGIFMLMVMLGSGSGLENGVKKDFSRSATNSFFVWGRSTSLPHAGLRVGRPVVLTNADTDAIRAQVPEARVIAPRLQLGGYGSGNNVTRGTKAGSFNVMGDTPAIRGAQFVGMDGGRFINELDIGEKRKVAVIGSRVVELLFEPGEDPVGEYILIRGAHFRVIGTFDVIESIDDAERDSATIYIPFTTFQATFNYANRVAWWAITSVDGMPASVPEQKVLSLMRRRHRIAPDDERALGHFNLEEEFNEIQGLFIGIRVLVWVVGIGTLAAGVIGVSNIMLVIVRERTNEIGIRRAIGATPGSIMGQVMLEAVLLTSVAGYAGLFLGVALMDFLAWGMARSGAEIDMFSNPGVDLPSAGKALFILVIAGALSGIIPARRAVRLTPVQALRAE
jgi:putative ABC transport system permease protein